MLSRKYIILLALLFLVTQAVLLYLMGQPLICKCGYIKFWEGSVLSSGNSQHISDWYTFSHIIHGFLFYFLIWIIFPRFSLGLRFLLALGIEVSWEVIENTPWVIELYRQQALASGYSGDSILNSICDSVAMILGFFIAYRIPWWLTLFIALIMEIFVAYAIRDNLALNILNLIHIFPAVQKWQMG